MSWQGWNYGDLFDAVATVVDLKHPALIHGEHTVTWGDLDRRTNNLARALIDGGAQAGEKIAFYLLRFYFSQTRPGVPARL